MTGCHTNTAAACLSACHEAPVKTLSIQANLSWSPRPTLLFLFSSQVIISCSHFAFLVWTVTCRYLALKLAALSLSPSSNRLLSLSIALDICPFLLILWPISAKLLFPRLPHGNLGEHKTIHMLRSLRIWCSSCFVATMISGALNALCLLSYPSSLLRWHLLVSSGLRRFLFHRLPTGVVFCLFSSSCIKPSNFSACLSFPTTAPALILINLPILSQ